MAGNSLESLLAWLKDESRMLGWDLIVALEGRAINRNLEQEYIHRLSQGTDLSDINLSIDIPDTNITQYLSGVTLAAPVLSFKEASLQSTDTALSLAVVGGSLMIVETVQGHKKIIRLSGLDPLNGSHVSLDLPIGSDPREVSLDLADSKDVLLTLFHTPAQQREAGNHLLARFKELESDRRVYPLGSFPGEDNPFMLTQRVDVRTQKGVTQSQVKQSQDENGAVLLFVSMVDGTTGDFPGDNGGFRFLVPDADGQKAWSGTALFSLALIHRAAFGHAMLQLLQNAEFDRVTDESGMLTTMIAKSGALQVPAAGYENLEYQFESGRFDVPASGCALPLTIGFDVDHAAQQWKTTFALSFRYRQVGGTTWQSHTATFTINLENEFHFSADATSALGIEGALLAPYGNEPSVSHVSGLPATIAPDLLDQINEFVAQTVKRAILEQLSNTLTATSAESFLAGFDVAGSSTLQTTDAALPFDLAMFGQVHSTASRFSIVQSQSIVAAGGTLQLSTEPPRSGLVWSVENLSESVSNPGSIDPQSGLYKAPLGDAMQGTFNRVLAIATDPDTGERSVALITVQSKPISVNPLIQTCFHGGRVELSGRGTGGGTLSWAIKNPVPGESGTLVVSDQPGGDYAYIAGPRVTNKTYVLDEIEITHGLTHETGSAWVLAIQQEPGVVIVLDNDPSQAEGEVQLQAWVNGERVEAVWSLPLGGPGSINASGLYTDDPLTQERFVLINAVVDAAELGKFEGHIILPLPLTDFPAVLNILAE